MVETIPDVDPLSAASLGRVCGLGMGQSMGRGRECVLGLSLGPCWRRKGGRGGLGMPKLPVGRTVVVKSTFHLSIPLTVARSDQHIVPFEKLDGLFFQDKVIFRARLTAILTLFHWLRTLH